MSEIEFSILAELFSIFMDRDSYDKLKKLNVLWKCSSTDFGKAQEELLLTGTSCNKHERI